MRQGAGMNLEARPVRVDAWLLDGFPLAQSDPMRRFVEQGEWWADSSIS